jgi:Cu2+-exporting ATPase
MWISGDVRLSLNIAVAVLIITCPCAMGLAVPAVTAAASGRLFRKGFLIKSATALERLAEVDTVIFDKTGTLTMGAPEALGLDQKSPEDLKLALAMTEASLHPLARALAAALRKRGVSPAKLSDVREIPGHGIEARRNGKRVRFGRATWVGATAGTTTATWLSVDGRNPVEFVFSDVLRLGAIETVEAFAGRGLRQVLLSGDAATPVSEFSTRVGIAEHHAEMTPEYKARFLANLAAEGRKVLMVGDGLNDTAALAGAHVSISPATAVDAARVASDIVLLGNDFGALPGILDTARSATRRIRENFAISAIYNLIAVPIALLGFATPLAAALAMSLSSISVTLNAMRVR